MLNHLAEPVIQVIQQIIIMCQAWEINQWINNIPTLVEITVWYGKQTVNDQHNESVNYAAVLEGNKGHRKKVEQGMWDLQWWGKRCYIAYRSTSVRRWDVSEAWKEVRGRQADMEEEALRQSVSDFT